MTTYIGADRLSETMYVDRSEPYGNQAVKLSMEATTPDKKLLERLSAALDRHIRPDTYPLAVRMVTAYLWKDGGYVSSRFSGRLDCADIYTETMKTGEPQVVLPCYGDRVFGQTQDHEMAFAFPAGKEEQMIEGFEGTHQGGIRYPTPSFLTYKPVSPTTITGSLTNGKSRMNPETQGN
ncbi:MAG: DUF169 domain-containing protein [bacterium]|nr:DUF169 domain-containing protein [bacterium]